MPTIEKHAPGTFSWIELATTDQTAAKDFYAKIFGWSSQDFPIGPNGVYTIFQAKDAMPPQAARFAPTKSLTVFLHIGICTLPSKAPMLLPPAPRN